MGAAKRTAAPIAADYLRLTPASIQQRWANAGFRRRKNGNNGAFEDHNRNERLRGGLGHKVSIGVTG
jgi:hypothetical protein